MDRAVKLRAHQPCHRLRAVLGELIPAIEGGSPGARARSRDVSASNDHRLLAKAPAC
jgi:hypothetical protein